MNSIPYR